MCDYDPPIDNSYDPEYPLESEDELDDEVNVKSSALRPSTASIQNEDLVNHSDLDYFDPPCTTAGKPEPVPAPKVYADLFCVKTYTPEELYPSLCPTGLDQQDPACYPARALALYWPVYVANFRLNSLDESMRNAQISTYFASKGLLSRMIYIREDEDEFFIAHQKMSYLLDMLVYFTSQEDAERAIRCCHRTSYYGHKLNVFSGRVPEYFDPQLTVRFKIPTVNSVEWTETTAELVFYRRGCVNIETIVKHSDGELIVEFGDVRTMNLALTQQGNWTPSRLIGPVRKQRYLEQDFQIELLWRIQKDPSFLSMVPPADVLQHLLIGKLPPIQRDWENCTTPRDLPPTTRSWIKRRKLERIEKPVENGPKRKAHRGTIAGCNGQLKKCKNEVKQEGEASRPSRPNRLERAFRSKSEEYSRTRLELLNKDKKKSFSARNKLFYNLLKVERELGNVVAKLGKEQECGYLKNGLTTALRVANEPPNFPPMNVAFSDEQEPLDSLHPVYVVNFRVSDLNPKSRNQQIIDFFARKDFTVKMIYVGDNDPFYNSYLKHIKLLDMLVYFKSKDIADKVIAACHSTIYLESKLSVFPGREAENYYSVRSAFLELDSDPTVGEKSIAEILQNIAPDTLDNLARFPGKAVFNFFNKMVQKATIATGLPLQVLRPPIPKQRFLESDVRDDLIRRILHDVEFLNDQPQPDALRQLFAVKSMPADPAGEVIWALFRKKKEMNARIGKVLDEWMKLQ